MTDKFKVRMCTPDEAFAFKASISKVLEQISDTRADTAVTILSAAAVCVITQAFDAEIDRLAALENIRTAMEIMIKATKPICGANHNANENI